MQCKEITKALFLILQVHKKEPRIELYQYFWFGNTHYQGPQFYLISVKLKLIYFKVHYCFRCYKFRLLRFSAPVPFNANVRYFFFISPNDSSQKVMKMLFDLSEKLFSFSIYSSFCISIFLSYDHPLSTIARKDYQS